jgi:hypothetical protein
LVGWLILLGLATSLAGAGAPSDPGRVPAPPPRRQSDRQANSIFVDRFADGSLEGWTADDASVWSVRDGVLRAELPDEKQAHSFLYAGDSTWADYSVDFDVCGMRGVDKGCAVRVMPGKRGLGIDLRGPGYDDLKLYVNQFPVGTARVTNANGTWHHVRVEVRGRDDCRVAINGRVVFDRELRPDPPPRGGIALSAYAGGVGQCTVYYANVVVTALAAGKSTEP